jgi:HlyD family secretion protein
VQNVVTYPVMLDVPNQDLKLKPGMTANVLVPVDVRHDVLRVPNAALRFRPDPADIVGGDKSKGAAASTASAPASGSTAGSAAGAAPAPQTGTPQTGRGGRGSPGVAGGARSGSSGGAGRSASPSRATVYVEVPNAKGKVKAVTVRTSITDGNMTAVESQDLTEGDEIIVGLATARAGGPSSNSSSGGPGGGRRPF